MKCEDGGAIEVIHWNRKEVHLSIDTNDKVHVYLILQQCEAQSLVREILKSVTL